MVVAENLLATSARVVAKWTSVSTPHARGGSSYGDDDDDDDGADEWAAGRAALELVLILTTDVIGEINAMRTGQLPPVSHAGHLSGFACGAVCMALVTLLWQPNTASTRRR